jgi:DNA-binding IclR family transcriptional regulator
MTDVDDLAVQLERVTRRGAAEAESRRKIEAAAIALGVVVADVAGRVRVLLEVLADRDVDRDRIVTVLTAAVDELSEALDELRAAIE